MMEVVKEYNRLTGMGGCYSVAPTVTFLKYLRGGTVIRHEHANLIYSELDEIMSGGELFNALISA